MVARIAYVLLRSEIKTDESVLGPQTNLINLSPFPTEKQ